MTRDTMLRTLVNIALLALLIWTVAYTTDWYLHRRQTSRESSVTKLTSTDADFLVTCEVGEIITFRGEPREGASDTLYLVCSSDLPEKTNE